MSLGVAAVLLSAVGGALLPSSASSRLRRLTVAAGRGRSPGDPVQVLRAARGALAQRRGTTAGRQAVVELCQGLSTELAAGTSAASALAAVSGPGSPADRLGLSLADAAVESDEVSVALLQGARRPGCDGLLLLDACWRVSDRSGSSLARPLTRVAESLRDDEQVRREVSAQLAGPRATVLLLALLPLTGVLLGGALGVSPLGWLVGAPSGRLCLAVGVTLEVVGCLWMRRIVRAALLP